MVLKAKTIDIHSHLFPQIYLDLLRARKDSPRIVEDEHGERLEAVAEGNGVPLSSAFWSVEEKLAFMDRSNLSMSLLSLGNPWLRFISDNEESEMVARHINNEFSVIVQTHSSRLSALGVLPSWNIDSAVKEVDNLSRENVLKGIVTGPTVCGCNLDDPDLAILWESLSDAGMIVMIHPGELALDGAPLNMTAAISFPFETTVAGARLLSSQVPVRFPRIRFILSHGGGALPFLLGRLDEFTNVSGDERPSIMAKSLFCDNLVYQDHVLWLASHAFGPDRVMFGTDHPFTDTRPEPLSSEELPPPNTVSEAIDHMTAAWLLSS